MTQYAVDRLASIMAVLNEVTGSGALEAGFSAIDPDHSGASNQIFILMLFDDAIRELGTSRLSEKAKERAISKLRGMRKTLLGRINACNTWEDFRRTVDFGSFENTLEDLSDLLEASGSIKSASLDRQAIVHRTQELRSFLLSRDLPVNVQNAADIYLRNVSSLVSQSGQLSDRQVGDLVKSTVADLLAEIERLEGDQSGLIREILKWGRASTHATAFALGLFVDSSAAIEMIGQDKKPRAIAPPSIQISDQSESNGK